MASGFRVLPVWARVLVAVGGGFLIGSVTYAFLAFYDKKRRTSSPFPRKFSFDCTPTGKSKRILVLGLDGAGKSSILAKFSNKSDEDSQDKKPTEGFHITCLQAGGVSLNIWEVGGSEKVRSYWGNFIQDTSVLVFVLDASDANRLQEAVTQLKQLVDDPRLQKVPIVVLANKQDISGAKTVHEIKEFLSLHFNEDQANKITVMGTQAPPASAIHSSVREVEQWLSNFQNS